MKEQPDLNKMIDDIQQIIDLDKNSQVRFMHVGTLMDILFLLKEKQEKKDENTLTYVLDGTLQPDGDFNVDVNALQEKFRKHIRYDDESETWKIALVTTDPYYVKDFLEELVVSYRCYWTHYWVIPLLYNMTTGILDSIFEDKKKYERCFMSGNYEGTELVLRKESV